jgi:hypothetical protein
MWLFEWNSEAPAPTNNDEIISQDKETPNVAELGETLSCAHKSVFPSNSTKLLKNQDEFKKAVFETKYKTNYVFHR